MFQTVFSHSINWQLVVAYVVFFLLMRIPYVGIHLKNINTFYHEIGHALMALIFQGEIYHIKLNSNNSGEALTATKGWFAKFFVSIAGYIFPLLLCCGIIVLEHYRHITWGFYALFLLAISATIMWIRNAYGYIWSISYLSLLSLVYYFRTPLLMKFFLIGTIAILLVENLLACITLVKLALKNPKQAGDAYSLKQYTMLPTSLWAFIFLTISLLVLLVAPFYCKLKVI